MADGIPDALSLKPVDYDPFAAEQYVNPLVKQALGDLATLPQRAIQNSQYSLDTGTYDPSVPVEAALTAMTGGVAGTGEGGMALGAGPIRAYHGSPHDFDKFSMDKIGTGEGAQAYGHGMYFAENEAVAKGYRDQLAHIANKPENRITIGDTKLAEYPGFADLPEMTRAKVNSAFSFHSNKADALKSLDYQAESNPVAQWLPHIQGAKDFIEKLPEKIARGPLPGGKMYEVNINADPEHFLDWDKPLAADHPLLDLVRQKSQKILDRPGGFGSTRNEAKDAILAAQSGNMTGAGAYKALALGQSKLGNLPKPTAATQALREAGIPGIKYLDQGSRGAGEGSRNYVVFDDNLINIVKKYGLAGVSMLPPAAASFLSQRIKPVDHNPFAQGGNPALTPVEHDPFNPDQKT